MTKDRIRLTIIIAIIIVKIQIDVLLYTTSETFEITDGIHITGYRCMFLNYYTLKQLEILTSSLCMLVTAAVNVVKYVAPFGK